MTILALKIALSLSTLISWVFVFSYDSKKYTDNQNAIGATVICAIPWGVGWVVQWCLK